MRFALVTCDSQAGVRRPFHVQVSLGRKYMRHLSQGSQGKNGRGHPANKHGLSVYAPSRNSTLGEGGCRPQTKCLLDAHTRIVPVSRMWGNFY